VSQIEVQIRVENGGPKSRAQIRVKSHRSYLLLKQPFDTDTSSLLSEINELKFINL
jgi:hypothetical protein